MSDVIHAGTFADHHQALTAIDRLVEAGLSVDRLSLVMSDRTAERHFAPPATQSDLAAPRSEAVARLATELRPAAALGTPGTGVITAGPVGGILAAAGLGTNTGLEGALEHIGVPREDAGRVAEQVKQGAIVVIAHDSGADETQVLAEGSAFQLELHPAASVKSGPVVVQPDAPTGDQHAAYKRLVQPAGDFVSRRQTGGGSQ